MSYIKKRVALTIMFLIITMMLLGKILDANAAKLHTERWYQDSWCINTLKIETESILSDGTRADCMDNNYVMEFDFGSKWYEGVTQTLHYMLLTQKQGVLVLIIEKESELKYIDRSYNLINSYNLPISLFIYKEYGIDKGVFDIETFKLLGDNVK